MADSAGVVGQNPFEAKARLDSISDWRYEDKLDQLSRFTWTVPNDVYHRANAFVERNAFVPFLKPFRGMVTDFAADETSIDLIAEEFATHLKRRIYTHDGVKRVTFTDENWYNASWNHRLKITINEDCIPDDSKAVPVLFDITSLSFTTHPLANGDDFLFTEKDGQTKIAHEIENFNQTTGRLIVWVKIPKLSDNGNVDFYVYYGNSGASNQEDIINVWKENYRIDTGTAVTTFDYAMVQHLDADSVDSTENNNDGTDTSISYVAADIIGNAANFDALNSKIDCGSGATIDDLFAANGWVTLHIDLNSDGEASVGELIGKGSWRLIAQDESAGFFRLRFENEWDAAATTAQWDTAVDIPISTDTRIDIIYDDSSASNDPTIYINGVARTVALGTLTETTAPGTTVDSDAANNLIIGNNTGQTSTTDGEIDEVRMMKVPPADIAHIIKSEYNAFSKTGFMSISPVEHYKEPANVIAQDILNSANSDMPAGVTWILAPDVPTTVITVAFNMKNHWQALDEVALILGKDLFFDNKNHIVFIETKGKTFGNTELLDLVVTSKPEKSTTVFANNINILGKKTEIGAQLESNVTTSTVLRHNYEVVVADNKIGTQGQADDIAATLLTQMQKLTPAIKGSIPLVQFLRLQMASGDIIKISQPSKQLNGSFRIMEVTATKAGAKIALEDIATGVIRQRSKSLSDTISTILTKLENTGIESA